VALVLQLPIGIESTFKGVVDLVTMKGVVWQDESLGAKFLYSSPAPSGIGYNQYGNTAPVSSSFDGTSCALLNH